jgi:hypothetical protein
MIQILRTMTEQQLTERLNKAEETFKQRMQMRGHSTLKSDQAWVEEAGIELYFVRQEIASRASHEA